MAQPQKKFIIIDGNALLHRAFHALPETLRTKDGRLTNAVYGFMLVFLKVLEDFQPEYAAAAFDRKGKTFRHQAFAEYKGKRKKAPDELYEQIPLVKKVLEAFEVPIFAIKGVEADDVVGALAEKVKRIKNLETIIVTGDLDTLQLVDEKTKVFTLRRGTKDTVIYDISGVKEKMGVSPEQVVDYKALAGDSSDNIPGVAGVGPRAAVELLNEYGDLETIYKSLDKIKEGLAKKLKASKKEAFLSQRLAKIQNKMELDFYLEQARFGDYDKKKVAAVLKELEFNTLIKRLRLEAEAPAGALVKPDAKKKAESFFTKFLEIKTSAELERELPEFLSGSKRSFLGVWERPETKIKEGSVFDCELKYLGVMREKDGECLLVDFTALELVKGGRGIKVLQRALEAVNKTKLIFFGLKQEKQILELAGVKLPKEQEGDAQLLAYLVNGGLSGAEWLDLAKSRKFTPVYFEKLKERLKGQTKLILSAEEQKEERDLEKLYLAERIGFSKRVFADLWDELGRISAAQKRDGIFPQSEKLLGGIGVEKPNLENVYKEIELPLLRVLAQMELTGIGLDRERLEGLRGEYQQETVKLRDRVMKKAGKEFNLDSSQQLSRVFYEDLGFSTAGIKKGKSGFYSTSAEALDILAGEYEVAKLVVRYRELTKLINTYIDPLPKLVNAKTGRLHTQFNQMITTTGRLSSSNPNLQNIPLRTPEGQRIREAFRAEDGFVLLSADYSQIELRLVAHYSGDKTMLKIFAEGGDIHTATAAKIHGLKMSEVTKEVRRTAKALNFGLIYGMGAFGFARSAKIPVNQARDFISKYKEQFPRVFEYLKEARDTAKEKGFVETMFGRRRYVPEMNSRNWQQRASGERMAVNMPLQGSAADIMKLAMVKVAEELAEKKLWQEVRMLLSVHDEILLEIKKDKLAFIAPRIKKIMEGVISLSVPLEVELKEGDNWGEMK